MIEVLVVVTAVSVGVLPDAPLIEASSTLKIDTSRAPFTNMDQL